MQTFLRIQFRVTKRSTSERYKEATLKKTNIALKEGKGAMSRLMFTQF